MPELYVDGAWASARRRRPPHDPLPRRRHPRGRDRRGRPRRHRAAIGAAYRRLPRRAVAGDLRPRAGRPAAPGRRPPRARRRRGGAGRVEATPASGWSRASTTSPTWSRSSATTAASRPRTPAGSSTPATPTCVSRVVHEPLGVCGADRALELPAAPGLLEGRALPGRRQHLRPQAERADPAHQHPPDAAARGGRPARRASATSSSAPVPRPRRPLAEDPRVDLVSFTGGLVTGRAVMASAAADGQEGRPRARRQEPQHRLRRRRPRGGPRLRPHRGLPALRPGLLGRRAAAGGGVHPRRLRRRAGRAGAARSGSAARTTRRPRPAR